MENICDLAKARTMVGKKFVRAIPDRTEVPMLVRIAVARSTLSRPTFTEKALVVWQQNSTEMPTVMTRLTREMALRVMFHQYMRPPMLRTMRIMMRRLMKEETISKPMNTKVTRKIAVMETARDLSVSLHMVRYCS